SESIGGVVALETKVGSSDGPQRLLAEGGSFGTARIAAEGQGELRGFRWFAGSSHEVTANDRSFNDFEQWQNALRVEQDLGGSTIVGMTARSWMSEFESPGDGTPFAFQARDERDAFLVTAYLEHAVTGRVRTKAVAGYYYEDFEESGPFPFESKGRKASLDLRNEVRWSEGHQSVIGGLLEWTSFEADSTPVDEDAWQTGLYVNHIWRPVEELVLALGGRWEHFDRWDDVLTWRGTVSWESPVDGVRLHGSYGTGFRAPSFFELFGRVTIPGFPPFIGDPNLEEERSEGWDAGIEWQPCEAFLVDVTYFHNRIEELIDFTPANIGEATTHGIEVEAAGNLLGGHLEWRGAYTWLEANDEQTGLRLARRPRHVA
ncbi:MAG: TonB-dependent receptor, partial [Akkermansiaceae bacterium]|nr:TonB-dependent receptor [Akkermansiaceae bacterium]